MVIQNTFYRPVLFGEALGKAVNYLKPDGYLDEKYHNAFTSPSQGGNRKIVLAALPQLKKVDDFQLHVLPMFKQNITKDTKLTQAIYTALERFFIESKAGIKDFGEKWSRFNTVYTFVQYNPLQLDFPPSMFDARRGAKHLFYVDT